MSALSNYYLVRAWFELSKPEPNEVKRSVKSEQFTVLSRNDFRAGLLIHNASDVVVYLAYDDEISADEYAIALDPGQSYHLEDAGWFKVPHGPIVGLAEASDADGVLQVTEWAHSSRTMPSVRQMLENVEEELGP